MQKEFNVHTKFNTQFKPEQIPEPTKIFPGGAPSQGKPPLFYNISSIKGLEILDIHSLDTNIFVDCCDGNCIHR